MTRSSALAANMAAIAGLLFALPAFWLLYVVWKGEGWLGAIFWFFGLGAGYGYLGPAPMVAIGASFLCFDFHAAPAWFAFLTYAVAGAILAVQLISARSGS